LVVGISLFSKADDLFPCHKTGRTQVSRDRTLPDSPLGEIEKPSGPLG